MTLDLAKLNTATKYPSIPTYHDLGAQGILQESGNPFAGYQGPIVATEKIDGANARVIQTHDQGWFIGSRDVLLTARGDRVYDPAHGIVDQLREIAEYKIWGPPRDEVHVYYFEVYGQNQVKNYRTYGDGKEQGVRLFDVATVPVKLLDKPIEEIAQWRDWGGQEWWLPEAYPAMLRTVPHLYTWDTGDSLPTTIEEMVVLLELMAKKTRVAINDEADGSRAPEGIVFRTSNRFKIFKARWENYNRTLQSRGQLVGPGSKKNGGK